MGPAKTTHKKDTRDTVINLRTDARDRMMIDCAAQALGKSRSDFILETLRNKAECILLDQRTFGMDEKSWNDFLKILDERVKPNIALRELLSRKAPWHSSSQSKT